MQIQKYLQQLFLVFILTTLVPMYVSAEAKGVWKLDVGGDWAFLGDSQTIGRAGQKHAISHAKIVKDIYERTYNESVSQIINGKSGRTLGGTYDAYLDLNNLDQLSWVHIQESGNQLSGNGVQATPEKYSYLLKRFLLSVAKKSLKAVITIETAYSFEAESMKGRDWSEYNKALIQTVDELKEYGTLVLIVDVDKNIKSLVNVKRREMGKDLGQQAVWGDVNNKIKRHYTGLGNLMVALSIFEKIGLDIEKLDLSSIPVSEISDHDKQLCINILKIK